MNKDSCLTNVFKLISQEIGINVTHDTMEVD